MPVNSELLSAAQLHLDRTEPSETPSQDTTAAEGDTSTEQDTTTSEAGEGEGVDNGEAGEPGEDQGSEESGEGEGDPEELDDQGTTAEEGEDDPDSEKAPDEEGEPPAADTLGKWDADQSKVIKAWLGDKAAKLPDTPETRALLKIAQDNNAEVGKLKQQSAGLGAIVQEFGNALFDHDYEAINKVVEELGGDPLPFDNRTTQDRIKEIITPYNEIFETLEKALPKEVFAQVTLALAPVEAEYRTKLSKLDREDVIRAAKEEGAKAAGRPQKGAKSAELKSTANKNYTDLKVKDPEAVARFDSLKPFFSDGRVLQDLNRAYAHAPEKIDELGKHVEFSTNFQKKYLPKIRETFRKEFDLQRRTKAPKSGQRSGNTAPKTGGKPKTDNFQTYAQNALAKRFG
jgi:hypothetical protein